MQFPEIGARVRWGRVALFLGLTFASTWLLDLFLWKVVGFGQPAMGLVGQLQMLMPAFSAMVLGLYARRGRRIPPLRLRGPSRVFVVCFLAYTLVCAALVAGAAIWPRHLPLFTWIGRAMAFLGLPLLVLLRVLRGRGALSPIGLIGARPRYWLLFGLGFVLFYGSQTLLNVLFDLGHPADLALLARQAKMPPGTFLAVSLIRVLALIPPLALPLGFGEEYGWRGYLQGELVALGKVRGVLLVGVIWGLWHAPLIVMGYDYPGHPVAGVFVMTLYTVMLAFVLGYAVLKTGSVWLAAYLHILNNQLDSSLTGLLYAPSDFLFSFGSGLYGIAVLAVIVLLILRDPVWREQTRGPGETA
ncbi:MAG: CPBP family intramembrane metalloprotease [Minicystis sp.]